jgi:hypothetical protein
MQHGLHEEDICQAAPQTAGYYLQSMLLGSK